MSPFNTIRWVSIHLSIHGMPVIVSSYHNSSIIIIILLCYRLFCFQFNSFCYGKCTIDNSLCKFNLKIIYNLIHLSDFKHNFLFYDLV